MDKRSDRSSKTVGVCVNVITLIMVVFVLPLSLPSCVRKNGEAQNTAEANIAMYELQTKNIEHLLVCLDHAFSMMPEQTNSNQSQATVLVSLLNTTTAQRLILQDRRETLGERQRLELTNMSKRLQTVHEDLRACLKALRGNEEEI